jgi:hypothetical protein
MVGVLIGIQLHFLDQNMLQWSASTSAPTPHEPRQAAYKAFEVRSGIFFIDYWKTGRRASHAHEID